MWRSARMVVLDPIVEADLRAKNIQDQTVAPGKNFNYLWGMVEAGSMFGWHAGVGTGARGESSTSAAPQMDTHVYAVAGDPREEKSRYQNFHITGSKGDVYTVAGWAKGDSVPLKDGTRKFGITARFTYTDGTTDDQTVSFNPDAEQWQYAAQRVVAKQDYTLLQIYLVYDNNENTAYFDGIQLFREEFGHSYVYDSDGNITSVTDLQKKTTTYEYKNNNLTKMVLPSGASQTYTYDSYHNVLTATSPEGVSSSFTYDTYGNNTQVSVGGTKKVTASAAYSADGNQLASVTDALGQTTSYGYDLQTGMLQWVQAPGETESTRTNYSYDGKLRATGVSKGASAVGYSYASDLLSAISTASGTDYSFAYGAFDLVQSIRAGSRTLISHSYSTDGNHQLTRSDYGNGDSVSYGYDSLGRTTSVRYEDGAQVDYTYDNNGNLGLLTDSASGRRTQYFYDFQDRLMRWEQSGSGYANSVTWGYDDNNNLSTQKQTLNGATYTTSYTYDKDNRLKSAAEGKVADRYVYDSQGRLTALVNENDSDDVLTTFIGYKDLSSSATSGQVKTWKVRPYGRTTYLYEGTYSYDVHGNIAAVSGTNNSKYTYDSFDQLASEENSSLRKKWVYTYDDGGNILSKQEYRINIINQTDSLIKTTTYTYGDESWPDLLTAYNGKAITYDGIGNPLSDGTWTYTWQHGRQLSEMSKSGTDITYSYDADGLRISKTANGTTYHYYYLDSQLVEMTWDSNKLHFTYDSAGPASVNYNGTIYNYIKNLQGDVVGIVDINGVVVVQYTYDAWGNPLSTSGTMASTLGSANPLRYRGYIYDTETGLYYLQSRYYNPTWGRFINSDVVMGINSDIGTYNLFSYCGNNPVNRYDNGGKSWFTCLFLYLLIPPLLYVGNACAVSVGIDVAAIGGKYLEMTKDSDGVYHATFDCFQADFGYNILYDLVFDWATSCRFRRFIFSYDGQEYAIWTWKGDYINMGAGAEMGIYTGGGPQWHVDKNLAMTMYVEVQYKGSTIISYSDYMWWITGFNPKYQRKDAGSLTASFAIRFKDPGMYNAFRSSKPKGWKFGLMQGFGIACFSF